jgi:hypothetical protein
MTLLCNTLFQFRRNHKFLPGHIIFNTEHIGFATDLAIFYIGLPASRGLVDRSLIALPATRALEAGFHRTILGQDKKGSQSSP